MVDLLADGHEVSLKFLQPDSVRFSVRQSQGRLTGLYWDRRVETRPDQATRARWLERGPGQAAVAAGTVLEVSLPLGDLGIAGGSAAIAFFVAVYTNGQEAERHPAHRPIDVTAPDALFEARHWRA
jgi:hypothetical protein